MASNDTTSNDEKLARCIQAIEINDAKSSAPAAATAPTPSPPIHTITDNFRPKTVPALWTPHEKMFVENALRTTGYDVRCISPGLYELTPPVVVELTYVKYSVDFKYPKLLKIKYLGPREPLTKRHYSRNDYDRLFREGRRNEHLLRVLKARFSDRKLRVDLRGVKQHTDFYWP
jgi:hypothetical protein